MRIHRLIALSLYLASLDPLNAEPLKVEVSSGAAILVNADTGAVLYEKEADQPLYPASLTKIASTAYTLKRGGVSLDSLVTAEAEALIPTSEAAKKKANYTLPAYWLENDGTHISLKKGEKLSLRDLLYGMMLASGNDASNVVAHYVGGSIPQFMNDVNQYLKEIGCQRSRFLNPHGLHHPDHVSTARDLALVACDALKNPTFCEIVGTVRYTRPKTPLQEASTMMQNNRLLRKGQHYYSKAIGIKTGYHSCAQKNLVAAARQGDRTLVAVLLKNADRDTMYQDVVRLFETAFKQPKIERVILQAGPQAFALKLKGANRAVETYLPEQVTYRYYPAEDPALKAHLYWDDVELPIKKGQRVGEIRIVASDGRLLDSVPLYASNEARLGRIHKIAKAMAGIGSYLWVGLLLLVGGYVARRLLAV